jgi:predicted enzyme related to lactoylglutathione lyase
VARATGIGGIFFRSRDPEALAAWYEEHLGITGPPWFTEAGVTVFSPFKADSDYFPADKQWMINVRVDDIEALKAELQAKGIAVETRAEWDAMPEYGRFARIVDPEGNHIELWEPPAEPPPAA